MNAVTPGSVPRYVVKLRLIDGMSFSSCEVTVPPICFDVVSTSGDSTVTVSSCSKPPTCSWMSIENVLPTYTRTPPRWYRLNPDSWAVTS